MLSLLLLDGSRFDDVSAKGPSYPGSRSVVPVTWQSPDIRLRGHRKGQFRWTRPTIRCDSGRHRPGQSEGCFQGADDTEMVHTTTRLLHPKRRIRWDTIWCAMLSISPIPWSFSSAIIILSSSYIYNNYFHIPLPHFASSYCLCSVMITKFVACVSYRLYTASAQILSKNC